MKKRLKVKGVIIFLAFVGVIVFPRLFLRAAQEESKDTAIEVAGIAVILLGQLLRISARGYKSEHSANGKFLIQDGPYSLVRNPMYLGILLIGVGILTILFKWWVTFLFLAVFLGFYLVLIFKEERQLLVLFGRQYEEYCRQVPRIFPRLMAATRDIRGFLPVKISWVKKELGPVIAVLLFTLLLESWEDIRRLGLAVYHKEALLMLVMLVFFIILVWYLSRSHNVNAKGAGNL
jgi:protein-S-isoprenylcysteine O-methyltransferase Ste14